MGNNTSGLLSVVLPCYNPPQQFLEHIKADYAQIQTAYPNAELILVNDGSTKAFNENDVRIFFLNDKSVKVISYPENRGKGYALRQGVAASTGETIIYTDVDFPYTQQSFSKIFNALQQGADLAVGIRSEEYYTHLPTARVRISKFLRFLIRKFLRIPTDDTQCGLKGFNQKGKAIFLQTTIDRYLFDLEFIFMAARKKAIIKTIPVELKPGIQLSSMNWKILMQEFGNFLKIFVQSIF